MNVDLNKENQVPINEDSNQAERIDWVTQSHTALHVTVTGRFLLLL